MLIRRNSLLVIPVVLGQKEVIFLINIESILSRTHFIQHPNHMNTTHKKYRPQIEVCKQVDIPHFSTCYPVFYDSLCSKNTLLEWPPADPLDSTVTTLHRVSFARHFIFLVSFGSSIVNRRGASSKRSLRRIHFVMLLRGIPLHCEKCAIPFIFG